MIDKDYFIKQHDDYMKDRFILDCHQYGLEIGYELDAYDLEEIYATRRQGETPKDAVNDYLDAYER